jgi:hypothetical protein
MEGRSFAAAGRVGDDVRGATDLLGKLGNAVAFSVLAWNLDANERKVTGSEARGRATFIDMIVVGLATIFNDESNNAAGEIHVLSSVRGPRCWDW